MRRKFIGTARGCGSLRGKCDQVGASELWELVDLVVHDGRGEWHRNGECCCLLGNTTLFCCTETESEQADLHIANSHHYVFNKAAAVRLRKVLNKAAAPATVGISASQARKLVHGTVSLQLASNYSTTEGIQYRREEYKTKGISYHSLKLFREQRMLFLLNEIFGSHIQEVCMTNCDVRFPSLAIQGALGCRPPLAYLQRNCGCGIFHCVHFSAWFLVSMQLKDYILRLQKKRTDTLQKGDWPMPS